MMIEIPTNYNPVCLALVIRTKSKQMINVIAQDPHKPNTYYAKRQCDVNGLRRIDLKFPVTPKYLVLYVFNAANGNKEIGQDATFEIEIKPKPLPLYEITISPQTKSFVDFAIHFSENASILKAGDNIPYIYRSDDGKFQIDYYNVIKNRQTGVVQTTPARVGHTYGVIEVSKKHFIDYTVPMRLIILLHEYSHKYMNPKEGIPIDNEVAADINALYIYMGLGFSEMEAVTAFLTVFKDANSQLNQQRFKYIYDFLDQWDKGKIATLKSAA